MKEGDIFNVFAQGEELKDPDTGEVLGKEEVKVGKVKITQVNPDILTLDVEIDMDVRVRPFELRDRTGHRDRVRRIEHGVGVMCNRRCRRTQAEGGEHADRA